jgi:hypothetical protein
VAQGVLGIARATIGRLPRFAADLRRVELLWFGQRQADSWLTLQGWQPPVGVEGWRDLAARARGDTVGASY